MLLKEDTIKIDNIIRNALIEDLGTNYVDVTSDVLIDKSSKSTAFIKTREDCIVSGLEIAKKVFHLIDSGLHIENYCSDGDFLKSKQSLIKIEGSTISILKAERVALNFLQRMCGISSLTTSFIKKSSRSDLLVLDTRKTTPGLRLLEKIAVRAGGGKNHRFGLYDAVMIKDNHFSIFEKNNDFGILNAIKKVKLENPNLKIHVEVDSIRQLKIVLQDPPDWVLLDNMSIEDLGICVKLCNNKCKTEASGDISLENIKNIAATGVDAVSIGSLTHSVKSVNLGLDFKK